MAAAMLPLGSASWLEQLSWQLVLFHLFFHISFPLMLLSLESFPNSLMAHFFPFFLDKASYSPGSLRNHYVGMFLQVYKDAIGFLILFLHLAPHWTCYALFYEILRIFYMLDHVTYIIHVSLHLLIIFITFSYKIALGRISILMLNRTPRTDFLGICQMAYMYPLSCVLILHVWYFSSRKSYRPSFHCCYW